jgi:Ca2+-binding RTX toxin-like protein
VTLALTGSTAVSHAPRLCFGKLPTITAGPATAGEVIKGTKGRDVILGNSHRNLIYAKQGRDRICGRGGNDSLGSGTDRADDWVHGGAGNDELVPRHWDGGSNLPYDLGGTDHLRGDKGSDYLIAYWGHDVLHGGDGPDELHGDGRFEHGGDGDELRGGRGPDVLHAAGGSDGLSGGPGRDVCDGGRDDDPDTADATCETLIRIP